LEVRGTVQVKDFILNIMMADYVITGMVMGFLLCVGSWLVVKSWYRDVKQISWVKRQIRRRK